MIQSKSIPLGFTEDAIEGAIGFSGRVLSKGRDEIMRLLVEDDVRVNSRFRYSLARRIVGYLATNCDRIVAGYVHGSTIHEDRTRYCSDIDIVLHVNGGSDRERREQQEVIDELERQLIEGITEKTGRPFPDNFTMLSVQLVTSEDEDFSALTHSLHDLPMRLYPRSD